MDLKGVDHSQFLGKLYATRVRPFIQINFQPPRGAYSDEQTHGISDDVFNNSSAVLGDSDEIRVGANGFARYGSSKSRDILLFYKVVTVIISLHCHPAKGYTS